MWFDQKTGAGALIKLCPDWGMFRTGFCISWIDDFAKLLLRATDWSPCFACPDWVFLGLPTSADDLNFQNTTRNMTCEYTWWICTATNNILQVSGHEAAWFYKFVEFMLRFLRKLGSWWSCCASRWTRSRCGWCGWSVVTLIAWFWLCRNLFCRCPRLSSPLKILGLGQQTEQV